MTELVCSAEFRAKAGMTKQLIGELKKLVHHTRQESGCLRYELHQCIEQPDLLFFVERFKDKAAFDAHGNMPYIISFRKEVVPFLVEQATTRTYEELSI